LKQLGDAYPVIARLANGNSVIVLGFREERVCVLDPLTDRPAMLPLDEATFCKSWRGNVVLLRRHYALTGEGRPFRFASFIPRIWRHATTFPALAVAAC